MKVYFDMEFTGLVPNTTPISLGMITETGEKFYAEFTDYNKGLVDSWVEENVIANLIVTDPSEFIPKKDIIASMIRNERRIGKYYSDYIFGTSSEVAENLKKWLEQFEEKIQLVGDCCHYDMVLFCNLFGGPFSMPECVNPIAIDLCMDIARSELSYKKDLEYAFNVSRETYCKNVCGVLPSGEKHNALYDAKVIKAIYERITEEKPVVKEEVRTKSDSKEIRVIGY